MGIMGTEVRKAVGWLNPESPLEADLRVGGPG